MPNTTLHAFRKQQVKGDPFQPVAPSEVVEPASEVVKPTGEVKQQLEEQVAANKVEFTEEEVKGYLDNGIDHWRGERDKGVDFAKYYVDAYQGIRVSLFNEMKSEV